MVELTMYALRVGDKVYRSRTLSGLYRWAARAHTVLVEDLHHTFDKSRARSTLEAVVVPVRPCRLQLRKRLFLCGGGWRRRRPAQRAGASARVSRDVHPPIPRVDGCDGCPHGIRNGSAWASRGRA